MASTLPAFVNVPMKERRGSTELSKVHGEMTTNDLLIQKSTETFHSSKQTKQSWQIRSQLVTGTQAGVGLFKFNPYEMMTFVFQTEFMFWKPSKRLIGSFHSLIAGSPVGKPCKATRIKIPMYIEPDLVKKLVFSQLSSQITDKTRDRIKSFGK